MAKFNAATAVEAMEYDFTAYNGSKGTIPEPSNGMVKAFFQEIQNLAREVKMKEDGASEVEDMSDADAAEFMASLDDEKVQEYEDRIALAVTTLCSGTPSVEEIKSLPYRVNGAFSAWLAGELRPEATRPATTR